MSTQLSRFLEAFPNLLHHREPKFFNCREVPWVFWSQSQNSSSSADVGTPMHMIHEKIKSAFSIMDRRIWTIFQLWVPVTIDGRRVLSASGQPFAVSEISNDFAMYRLYSTAYKYSIDVNKVDIGGDHMIISGGPATAFLSRLPCINRLEWIPSEAHVPFQLEFSIMLPVCFPSQSYCIGVLEFTTCRLYSLGYSIVDITSALEEDGLAVFDGQHLIPYKTINGLETVKEEINEALKIVCGWHNITLAQVWITYEDKSHVPLSSFVENTPRIFALKLTEYFFHEYLEEEYNEIGTYARLCDVIPQGTREELALKALQGYESCYISKLGADMLMCWEEPYSQCCAFTICLRSIDTGDFDYAFEFIWIKPLNCVFFLEAILFTLKRCLPSFKLASGAELGEEMDVIDVESSTDTETISFKIFQGKMSSPMSKELKRGKKPSHATFKTSSILLSQEVIENQFGKTMKDAAKNLKVSLSTFKRKFKDLGMQEWPGPNFVKGNVNDSSIIQINTDENDNEAIQDLTTVSPNNSIMTLKAEYSRSMIKFYLPISQATFVIVEKEISTKFNLSLGTYNLTYLDEDGDWILLTCDEEMNNCIESSKKSDGILVRVRVLPSPSPQLAY